MTIVKPRLAASGTAFFARSVILPGLICEDPNDPGEIGIVGRFRGKCLPRGSATFLIDSEPSDWEKLEQLAPRLPDIIALLIMAQADDINFHLDIIHDGQCNFDLSPVLLKSLAGLPVSFTISCWSEDVL
jgi:hypothetical protein